MHPVWSILVRTEPESSQASRSKLPNRIFLGDENASVLSSAVATSNLWLLSTWNVARDTGGVNFTFDLVLINLNLATCASGYSIRQHSSRSRTSLQVIQGIEDSVKGTP